MTDDIAAVKSRLDIVSTIGGYVSGMRKSGRNYSARCPFHSERSASFMVNPDLQIFKCFGCGQAGDVIAFIQKIERVDFSEALKLAAEKAGYTLTGKGKDVKHAAELETLAEMNKLTAHYWNFLLTKHNAGKPGRDYCEKRAIRSEEIALFEVGYAPAGNNLTQFLRKKTFTDEQIFKAGLAVERNGQLTDKFRQRLMLPIFNLKGQIVGFSGRIVVVNDKAPKYLNSPETALYKKSEILMGMFQAKEASRELKFLVMQEGNIDLLSSHKAGVANIVATGGTAITSQQFTAVKRLADSVYFCFDTDIAGRKALIKAVELAEKAEIQHFVIDLGAHKDPDEMITESTKLWQAAVKNPQDSVEYLLKVISSEEDLATAKGKRAVLNQIVPILKSIKEPVSQEHYAKVLAVKLETSIESVQTALTQHAETPQSNYARYHHDEHQEEEATPVQQPMLNLQIDNKEKYFLALLCANHGYKEITLEAGVITDAVGLEVLEKLQAEKSGNFSSVSDQLSEPGKLLLQDLLTTQLADDETTLSFELEKIYKTLYIKMLRRKMLAKRAKLSDSPEDATLLDEVQEISHQLAILEK